jgi:hypothetical protein
MADIMATAASWFESQRQQYLTVPVDYRIAGTGHPIPCRATVVIGRWESVNSAGQVVRMETRDFIIASSELHHTPERGDTITLVEGPIEAVCKVVIPEGNDQAWRWSDRSHTVRRIHTMETARYENA